MKTLIISFTLCAVCALAAVEFGVRRWVLPQNFLYIQVNPDTSPFFGLVDRYDVFPVSIRDHRHEGAQRGGRRSGIAFVGDSVTFCANVKIEDCFVEQLQNSQTLFDAYNFGVPGYGIVQVEQQLDKVFEKAPIDWVVYTFNFNDIHSAAPVLLTLLEPESDRLVALEDYQGPKGSLKKYLRRYYQTPLVLNYFYSTLSAPTPEVFSGAVGAKSLAPKPQQDCLATMKTAAQGYLYRTLFPVWEKMYTDPKVVEKLSGAFARLKNKVEAHGARLVVIASYDFLIVDKKNSAIPEAFRLATEQAGIDTVNLYPLFASHYSECSMYSDPGHPGKLGHRLLARRLLPEILNRLDRHRAGSS
ncbi:MAG: SGNH/GDSL hydrolase family protein [Bdellovibrionales bacterium]|nr:SGNH/GDSL hydrolase family protein [Bdellovibrionales bacterium]